MKLFFKILYFTIITFTITTLDAKSHNVVHYNFISFSILNSHLSTTIVVNGSNQKYTKHFFIEGQRIASKIGDRDIQTEINTPKAGSVINVILNFEEKSQRAEEALRKATNKALDREFSPTKGELPYGQMSNYFSISKQNTANYENLQFFYHPDHLGSSNYITDVSGEVYQHLEYFPSGETFVEQRKNTEYTTYYFSGKELDTETGLYYFGARYYDPRTSIFLTVDPLMDKYPGVSSYAYCANNPVKLIDLDGLSPKPPRSRIEYRGNGIFGININSLNKATRQNYYNAGRNSNNWTTNSITGQKDIGISTTIAEIKINYTPISNIVGVKNTTVTTEAEKSNSTGLPDSRVKPRNINTVGSGAGTKGFGAFALGLNAVNLTYDYWNTFSLNGDMNAIENQKGLLQKSFEAVNMGAKYGLVPPQYQNKDDMGAITNFVFQGVNDTGNQDITTIGTDILKSMGRYDKNTNQVKPIIEE